MPSLPALAHILLAAFRLVASQIVPSHVLYEVARLLELLPDTPSPLAHLAGKEFGPLPLLNRFLAQIVPGFPPTVVKLRYCLRCREEYDSDAPIDSTRLPTFSV